jgi:hypothetical protein
MSRLLQDFILSCVYVLLWCMAGAWHWWLFKAMVIPETFWTNLMFFFLNFQLTNIFFLVILDAFEGEVK